ncbi:MAG: hypothetical protein HY814_11090 [Candidatus Riflebacteria bacterium]|nr:hypothetical protein [Candidatus Riflebacteria bacterium]
MLRSNWEQVVEELAENPGSHAAFERPVLSTQTELCRAARRCGLSPQDAEEVVQDVFLQVGRYLAERRVREPRALPAFLRLSVKRAAWRRGRKLRRERLKVACSLDAVAHGEAPMEPKSSVSVEESVLERAENTRVEATLAEPVHGMKCPLSLYLAGLSYKAIAARLGLPLGTVKVRIHRRRQQLNAGRG